jgi:hypothetical protein
MNKINIVNVDYDIEVINEADDYMVKNNLQAYCDYNETKITISRKYIDGTIKTHRTLIIDLLHEILHAYFYETGTTELNNELAVECVSMMMINQDFLKKAKDIIELI